MSALIVLMSLALVGPCLAQDQKIDSLKSLLEKEFGSRRGEIFYELAYNYTDTDNKVAMTYVNEATKLIETSGDSLMIVKCGRLKSLLHRRFDEMDSSLMLSERILPIAERNKYSDQTKKILNGMALVYSYQSMYDKALSCYLRILESTDLENNKVDGSVVLNNVGLVYYKLDNIDKALNYFEKALALKYEANIKIDLELVLLNIGLCHVHKGNYALAKEFTEKVIDNCKEGCPNQLRTMCSAHYNLGLIAYDLKQLPLAEKHFLESYAFAKKIVDERFEMDDLFHLFQIYIDTKNILKAKSLIKDAELSVSKNPYYREGALKLYGQLAKIYHKFGDIRQVAHYQSKYIQLRDSVFNEELTKNLMKVEAEYLERENKAKIEAQAKILELSDDVITRQRAISIGVCIVALLSIAIVVVLMQNVKQKKLANLLLEQKVKERTSALEANHVELLKSLEERNQQVKRITTEIKSSMATIRGLCQLSLQDVNLMHAGQYIHKIERASDTLQSGIYRTLGIKDNAA